MCILEIGNRCAKQQNQEIKNLLFRRVLPVDPAASEATTEPARALPAPAPVAGGSGQLVQPPALPSVRPSAAGSRHREPGIERSAHTRTRALRWPCHMYTQVC
jgi:hypothetical protein